MLYFQHRSQHIFSPTYCVNTHELRNREILLVNIQSLKLQAFLIVVGQIGQALERLNLSVQFGAIFWPKLEFFLPDAPRMVLTNLSDGCNSITLLGGIVCDDLFMSDAMSFGIQELFWAIERDGLILRQRLLFLPALMRYLWFERRGLFLKWFIQGLLLLPLLKWS